MLAIFDIDNWREIGATLARNKTRTFLTAFGIFWGTAMLAMLWGGAQGLRQMLESKFEGFATNSAIMYSGRTSLPYKGYQKGRAWTITLEDVDRIGRFIPGVATITAVADRQCKASSRTASKSFNLQGVDAGMMSVIHPTIVEGRFINDADCSRVRKVAVIGTNVASELFPGVSPIGQVVEVDNVYYQIVGVARSSSEVQMGGRLEDNLMVPISVMQRTYGLGGDVDYVMLIADDGYTPSDLRPRLQRMLSKVHNLHPDDRQAIGFWDISDQFEQLDNMFKGVNVLVLFVGLSSLLAGIIGVGNIMWIIVRERTQEFGIRRAMGALPSNLITQILSESMVLTFFAGMAGICFAVLVLGVATMVVAPQSGGAVSFQLTIGKATTVLVAFLALGTAAGILPAIKAMKIKPIEALNNK